MTRDLAGQEPRRFHVYKGSLLVLKLEDRPGTLHSTASPGPGGPLEHPFLHAEALDALSEDELGRLLSQSSTLDDYLAQLIVNGYDVAPGQVGDYEDRAGAERILDASGVVGVIWPQPGRFATLEDRPAAAELALPFTLTVYKSEAEHGLLQLVRESADFNTACGAIAAAGFQLEPVA
jgi:hypothetical protein